MREVAELPVLNASGPPVVPARIDGRDVGFVVDTGAPFSAIDPAQAQALKLRRFAGVYTAVLGVGGISVARTAFVHELDIGGAVARNVRFPALIRMNGSIAGRKLVGTWGADFLSNYDVEFDLPSSRIGLYVQHGQCGTNFTPWDSPAEAVPIEVDADKHAIFTIHLDGAPVRVALDSGSSLGVISASDAAAAAVSKEAIRTDHVMLFMGFGAKLLKAHVHRFATLQVGDERSGPVLFAIARSPFHLLGADWLRTHRVWLSYSNGVLLTAVPTLTR